MRRCYQKYLDQQVNKCQDIQNKQESQNTNKMARAKKGLCVYRKNDFEI